MAFTGRRGDSQYSARAPLPLNSSMWAWNTNTHIQVACAGEGGSWVTRNDSFHTCGQWWLGHSPSSTVTEPRPPSRADTIPEFLLAAPVLHSHCPTFSVSPLTAQDSISQSFPLSQEKSVWWPSWDKAVCGIRQTSCPHEDTHCVAFCPRLGGQGSGEPGPSGTSTQRTPRLTSTVPFRCGVAHRPSAEPLTPPFLPTRF